MQFNHTLSAILRGTWLLDKSWADAHMPMVLRLIKGEPVNLGQPLSFQEELKEAMQLSAAGYKVGYYTRLDTLPHGSVAIVDLVGPVVRYGGMCSYGLEDKANLMRKLYSAPNISGIILNTNTPGGEASGTAMFANVIKTRSKPVIAHIEDGMAASAGAWIVSQCDEVYVSNKQSEVGSIGAYTVLADWYGYFESEGLKIHEIYAPQSTDKNKDYRDALEGNYTGLQEHLKELVENFKADVIAGRNGKIKTKGEEPFTGKMYNATAAKRLGLIDGIASLEEVIGKVDAMSKKKKMSSNQSNNTMAENKERPNLAKAAGWTEGAEADEQGNVTLTAAEADQVETTLATGSTAAQTVIDQQAQIATLTADLATRTTERDNLQAEVTRLGSITANDGTPVVTGEENAPATTSAPVKKVDPVTAQAQQVYERNKRLHGDN